MPKTAPKPKPDTNGHTEDVAGLPPPTPQDSPADDAVEMVEIVYRGETFTIPKDADDWRTVDLETLYRQNNVFDVVKACIGEEQWRRFNDLFPRRRDFRDFSEQLGETIREKCVGI